MFRSGGWNGLPAGSQVSITLSQGPTGVSGTYTVDRGPGAPILQAPLGSGNFPLKFTVQPGEHHKVNVDATSTGADAQVTLDATVTAPGGVTDTFRASEAVTGADPVFTIKVFANG